MAETIRLGLIGCGSQGRYLSEAARVSGLADLVSCADPKPEAAQRAVQQCGYQQAFDDPHEMLAKADVEAVVVATIHDQLQPMALAAVQAGKHVLVEKPMALCAAHGQALVDAAKQAGVKLMVGYSLRFQPERIHMKQLLDAGAVGDIAHVTSGQLIGNMGGWLGEKAHGGGPMFYVGSHATDQVLWVVRNPIERVFAEVNWKDASDVEADASFTIRFAGGVVAQVITSQRMGGRYGWMDVVGSAGRVRAQWESQQIYVESRAIKDYAFGTTIDVPADAHHPRWPMESYASLTGFRYIRTWAAELTEFITAIRENRAPSVPGEDGVRLLQVADAIFESARTGQAVDLK